MSAAVIEGAPPAADGWLLALHSAADGFGVGLLPLPLPPQDAGATAATLPLGSGAVPGGSGRSLAGPGDPLAAAAGFDGGAAGTHPEGWWGAVKADGGGGDDPLLAEARLAFFPTGRDLSNRLLACLETVLPAREWPRLRRLAVATGPGGFTSTRLTVVLARTLAQQDDLPLDGVSSFRLIARRHCCADSPPQTPFWLVQDLPRRGRVAGLYGADPAVPGGVAELEAPRLRHPNEELAGPVLPAEPSLPADVGHLLAISLATARLGWPAPWSQVVPLYPTSPVQQG